ncbi:hypothetical protein RclHR1_09980002 [Rhizophagus clarus]|uniref:F-box domain-containing protein n=1 Tax=Rhizophagus clarus TaxID=94130 RepID=A0A2Z6S678_9GLOM|nr:hypothetical protein RclHR1_09980002 [Rhizophagus clarus]
MTCSKTFTGDIPELTYDILKYLHDDYSTLHSCDLVDRLWCRLAIPLLWENPFSIATGNRNFIEIYLRNLDGDLKTRLNEYEINDNSLFSNTLFNYPRFLKYLNTDKILCSVWKWFDYSSKRGNKDSFSSMCSVSDFGKLIYTSIFNENEVVLHIFEIDISDTNNKYYGTYYDNIFELILQNKNFFRNIKYLNLYIDDSYEDDLGDNTDSYTCSYPLLYFNLNGLVELIIC